MTRQLMLVPTVRRLVYACAALGVFALPLNLSSGPIAGKLVGDIFLVLTAIRMDRALRAVTDAKLRAAARRLGAVVLVVVGGFVGEMYLSSMHRRFSDAGVLVSLLIPGALAWLFVRDALRHERADRERLRKDAEERAEVARARAAGEHVPMLACRGIDFSYGQLQVLFDVDFAVDEGEMVALLGVNGAGKSTLLKVISGIGLPSSGTVRLRGDDITYVDAELRPKLGITQIPGGRAVFAPMTVVDNMRTFGYTLGRDAKALSAAIDESFEAFPRLAERRNQLAGTLSGGEQQMLALSKALILRPQLLLIDELSLGLAPIIVGQLLEMVRRINADGTAVVLVEQSVNIALNLVNHAYFMEKGEIRFDGNARDLLTRDDLLRAVFLEGAGAGAKSGQR